MAFPVKAGNFPLPRTIVTRLVLNANAGLTDELNGAVTINTGTDTSVGSEFQFTPDGQFTVDGSAPPVKLNGIAGLSVASNGDVILQTGNDSTGPLDAFVFGTDGKINGQTLGGSTAPTTPAAADSGWLAPTLIGTWVNNGNTALQTQAPAGYRKIGKQVFLRGLVKNPGTTAIGNYNLFRLPVGYYPGRQVFGIINSNDKPALVKIQTDGWVQVQVADPAFLSLDGVSFLID